MARTFVIGFGCGCAGTDGAFYATNGIAALPTGWSYTSVGAEQCLAVTNPAGAAASYVLSYSGTAPTFGASDFASVVLRFRITGTITAGHERTLYQMGTGGTGNFNFKYASGSTFNLNINSGTVGATTFNTDTWYTVRLDLDGAGDTMSVYYGGVLEATAAQANGALTSMSLERPTAGDPYTFYFAKAALYFYSTGADRPGDSLTTYFLTPASDSDSSTFGNDVTNCNDGAGSYAEWDDWATGNDDGGTTFNNECGGNAGKEVSVLSTATVDTSLTCDGYVVAERGAAAANSKTVTTYLMGKDVTGGTEDETQVLNLESTAYRTQRIRRSAPPAGAWTDYVNGTTFNHASATKQLGAGVRSIDTNGANDNHSAIGVELFFVDNDPAATATRRRVGPTLLSPGVF